MSSQVEIIVRNSTPLLIGWYDPLKTDPQGLRATEIKGLWRWWSRAFIAGALYDKGLLLGRYSNDVLLEPTESEVECISCLAGKVLGLGFTGKNEAEASRFILYTEPLKEPVPKPCRDGLQRIQLLTIGKRGRGGHAKKGDVECQYIERGHIFKIAVEKRYAKYRDGEELAIKILLAALQLSGLGKGSRRGLGSLDIENISNFSLTVTNLKELIKDIYEGCTNIVDTHYDECCKRKTATGKTETVNFPPPMPVMSKKSVDNLKISQVIVAGNASFEPIHNFFVRTERCKVLYKNPRCFDELRENLSAWVLGLPRIQRRREKGRGKEKETWTGYETTVSRRASPILVSYHSDWNMFGKGALISIFISGDWPTELTWSKPEPREGTPRPKRIKVDFNVLYKAYRAAIGELTKYLERLNFGYSSIWP